MIFPLASRKRSKRDRMFLMTGLSPGPCRSPPSACISTMIRPVCSGESSTVRSSSTTNLRFSRIEVLALLTKPDSPRQVSLIEIFLGGFRNFDLFEQSRNIFSFKPDIEIVRVILQGFPLNRTVPAQPVASSQRYCLFSIPSAEIHRFPERP